MVASCVRGEVGSKHFIHMGYVTLLHYNFCVALVDDSYMYNITRLNF